MILGYLEQRTTSTVSKLSSIPLSINFLHHLSCSCSQSASSLSQGTRDEGWQQARHNHTCPTRADSRCQPAYDAYIWTGRGNQCTWRKPLNQLENMEPQESNPQPKSHEAHILITKPTCSHPPKFHVYLFTWATPWYKVHPDSMRISGLILSSGSCSFPSWFSGFLHPPKPM